MVEPDDRLIAKHYEEHKRRDFYSKLVDYMRSGPVVAMCWAGPDAAYVARSLVGPSDPKKAPAGTIRGDFCVVSGRNVVHSADSNASADREIELWFDERREIFDWEPASREWVNEGSRSHRGGRRNSSSSRDGNGGGRGKASNRSKSFDGRGGGAAVKGKARPNKYSDDDDDYDDVKYKREMEERRRKSYAERRFNGRVRR